MLMLQLNYFKIALRNLIKHKSFSLISIIGLAASMSVCLVIIIFMKHQLSFDDFHEKADRIYHIYSDYKAPSNSSSHFYATSPVSLGEVLQSESPLIEDYISLRRFGENVLHGDQTLQLAGYYANGGLLNMLSFPLKNGDTASALTEPFSMVLTDVAAERIFGESDPMGEILSVKDVGDFKVTGIMATVDKPTVFEFEALVSFPTLFSDKANNEKLSKWDNTVRSSFNFVLLKEGGSPGELSAQLPGIISSHFKGDDKSHLVALHPQALTAISTGPIMDNMMKFMLPIIVVYILGGIALMILFAACFNYVGLSVARALGRAKEIGVRKVIGAQRAQIIRQFLIESICISLLALGLASLFMTFLIDGFNNLTPIQFTKAQIAINYGDLTLYLIVGAFGILVGLIAGLYPAIYLSSFMPAVVLKGLSFVRRKGFTLRKLLIVTQFSLSMIFIVSTFLLYQQSKHLAKASYGFNEKGVLNVELKDVSYDIFRSEMIHQPGVENISAASIMTGEGSRSDTWMLSEEIEERQKGYTVWVDDQFIENLQIPLLAGRSFAGEAGIAENAVLINQTAVERLKLGSPESAVNRMITLGDSTQAHVIGIVSNYRFFSAMADVDPLVLRYNPEFVSTANLRFTMAGFDPLVTALQTTWQKLPTTETLEYDLYEDQLANAMELKLMEDFLHIIGLVAGFAILIALLGLLGMATFMIETRLKEIGVRKVLGASTAGIVGLLSKSFVIMIGIALIIAAPLSWMINGLWLEQIGNRIEISPMVFLVSALFLLLAAALTIGTQMARAARTKITDILQYE